MAAHNHTRTTFTKGTGGRKKNVPNRITQDFREIVKAIVEKRLGEIDFLLDKLPPEKRLNCIMTLLSYCIPKPSADFTDQERAQLLELLRANPPHITKAA